MDAWIDDERITQLRSLGGDQFDLTFLPAPLMRQCAGLIETYHEVHGFRSLPNMLWQFHLGPLIERHDELKLLLRRASTTRSAKIANTAFVEIATTILSLEILTSNFAGWSQIYPAAAEKARDILQRNSQRTHMPLMDFYLYPPKQISAAAVAALVIPTNRTDAAADFYRASDPELSDEKRALQYANLVRSAQHHAKNENALRSYDAIL